MNRVWGNYVDKSGVPLTNGGGTLVLSAHSGVSGGYLSLAHHLISRSQIYGPGGQDVYQDVDGPILVYHYYTSSGHWVSLMASRSGVNC